MKKRTLARRKGRLTETVGKAYAAIEFRKRDRKYNVFPLESKRGFESHKKTKGGYEAAGIVDSIAVRKKKDPNKLEIVLIERKVRGRSKKNDLPSPLKDAEIKKELERTCKSLDIKYAIFRHKIGGRKDLKIFKVKM